MSDVNKRDINFELNTIDFGKIINSCRKSILIAASFKMEVRKAFVSNQNEIFALVDNAQKAIKKFYVDYAPAFESLYQVTQNIVTLSQQFQQQGIYFDEITSLPRYQEMETIPENREGKLKDKEVVDISTDKLEIVSKQTIESKNEKDSAKLSCALKYVPEDSTLLIEGTLKLHRFCEDMENETVIRYLLKNPYKKITREELKKYATKGKDIKKNFHEILKDCGLTGKLRKKFFNASTRTIEYIPDPKKAPKKRKQTQKKRKLKKSK